MEGREGWNAAAEGVEDGEDVGIVRRRTAEAGGLVDGTRGSGTAGSGEAGNATPPLRRVFPSAIVRYSPRSMITIRPAAAVNPMIRDRLAGTDEPSHARKSSFSPRLGFFPRTRARWRYTMMKTTGQSRGIETTSTWSRQLAQPRQGRPGFRKFEVIFEKPEFRTAIFKIFVMIKYFGE